ncbi:MAG: hypothetical protein CM15mP13_1700 [Pseudomonadota bacterium]|nr:MAG: hypothetical protein CM15mP13_1700 [Pseudomonadota bacterium]
MKDGFIDNFNELGAKVFANAWTMYWPREEGSEKKEKKTIVHFSTEIFRKKLTEIPTLTPFRVPELVTALE